uniref:Uncharacterized protein n=1 Tax=Aegilops tauschii subsp. strangulata TaxID=200361 RepID=A0A453P547_AEGTS
MLCIALVCLQSTKFWSVTHIRCPLFYFSRANETSDNTEMGLVKDGDYVIVNGGLKGFQGKRHIVAYSVRLVTNYNDITHHFLYCIYVHLDLAKAKKSATQPQVTANASTWNQAPPPNNQKPGAWS